MSNFTASAHRLPLDENGSYPPSPFLAEELAPSKFRWLLMAGVVLVLSSHHVFNTAQVANSHAPATTIQAIVAFTDKPEIVVLNYPTAQAVPTLINDAKNLVRIK